MARRGLADRTALAFCSLLAPGFTGRDDEVGHRIIRSPTFLRDHKNDIPWAHPVEGLIVHIDLTAGRVIRVEDEGDVPVPAGHGRYHGGQEPRTTLKPIEITQPEGPGFTVTGSLIQWQGRSLRVGFNAREGLVLHQVEFQDRPVVHRASVPEMVVPYSDTSPSRSWISYFDAGKYLLGKNANPLSLGCDCVGTIRYFDAHVADDAGHPMRIPQAICIHEEDDGVQWKHTEPRIGPQVRRARRLVISSFSTIGNYAYGFFWYSISTVRSRWKPRPPASCSPEPASPVPATRTPQAVPPLSGAARRRLLSKSAWAMPPAAQRARYGAPGEGIQRSAASDRSRYRGRHGADRGRECR